MPQSGAFRPSEEFSYVGTHPATAQQGLPTLPQSTIWMISFGFLGVQTAFTLQSSQMSRIFQTLGADPHSLGWFFILPPLAGLLVQPTSAIIRTALGHRVSVVAACRICCMAR